jgi:hypothetical protein
MLRFPKPTQWKEESNEGIKPIEIWFWKIGKIFMERIIHIRVN